MPSHRFVILLTVLCIFGLVITFNLDMFSRPRELLTSFQKIDLDVSRFQTGDLLLSFEMFPGSSSMLLDPGHLYMVVEDARYNQKFLWDLTFWNSPQALKTLPTTLRHLCRKKVPVFAFHLHHQDPVVRQKLAPLCRRKLAGLTSNLRYDPYALMDHLIMIMENVLFLPSVRNPWVDVTQNKQYCSLYIFHILAELGVFCRDILSNIPHFEPHTGNIVPTGGRLAYPELLLHKNMDLNSYTKDGWWFSFPYQLETSAVTVAGGGGKDGNDTLFRGGQTGHISSTAVKGKPSGCDRFRHTYNTCIEN